MCDNNCGRNFLIFAGGAAIGAAIGILFAPAKGSATRRKIASTTRDMKNSIVDKLEELVSSAEEIVDEFRDNAAEAIATKKDVKVKQGK